MNTKTTSTKALTRSAATRRRPRRLSKLALLRVKVVTIISSLVLFIAGLAGIALYNPGVASKAATPPAPVQQQHITIVQPGRSSSVVQPGGSGSTVVVPPPRVSRVMPLTRSRGS